MQYTISKPPSRIRKLPKPAKKIWIEAFNSIFKSTGDSKKAIHAGWKAVRDVGYTVSSGGKWEKTTTDDIQLFELAAAKKEDKKVIAEADELSLYQKRNLIEQAVEERFGQYSWSVETYDTYVVVKVNTNSYSWDENSSLLKVDYTFADDFKSVTLATNTTPVEKKTEYVEVAEATLPVKFIEAKGKKGSCYKVRLIAAGLSLNNYNYPSDVLKAAVPLFEGVRAIARSDEDHVNDLNTNVNNIVGWYENPRFEDDSIVADFMVSAAATNLKVMMKDAWDRGKPDLVQLSIVALGTGVIVKGDDGSEIVNVESLVSVKSVDTIVNAAAGGELIELRAAHIPVTNMEENEHMLLEKILKFLEAKFPEHFKRIKDQKNVEEVTQIFNEATAKIPEVSLDTPPSPSPAAIVPVAEASTEGQSLAAETRVELTKLRESIAAERKDLKKHGCALMLTESIAASTLPEPMLSAIRTRFDGKIFERAELDAEFASNKKVLAQMSESGNITGFGENRMEIGKEERDKVLKAFEGFFLEEDVDEVPRYESFREAYKDITGDVKFTGQLREAKNLHKFTESMTTDSWTQLLGDSITRKMLREYNTPGFDDWKKIVSDIVPISDFRDNKRMRMGGYGLLPSVGQTGTYNPLTSPTDEEANYAISKRGGLEDITLEMIANDDVGAIRRVPKKLGRAAAITLYRYIFDFILNNATTTYDSDALFHSNHGNLGSVALSAVSLLAAKVAMADQAAYGAATDILGLVPRYLCIPSELEDVALRLTTSPNAIANQTPPLRQGDGEPNIHATYGLKPLVVPYWTDANNWTLVCNPKDCPTIEVGFFQGRQQPELFVQDQPNVGSMFTADKITYKIRHIYGAVPVEHRGMYKAVVA